jgi:hypothetical protein
VTTAGRPGLRAFARRTAVAASSLALMAFGVIAVLSGLLGATRQAPRTIISPSPVLPSVEPSRLPPAGELTLIGWQGERLLALGDITSIGSRAGRLWWFDPASHTWSPGVDLLPGSRLDSAVTDGSTLATLAAMPDGSLGLVLVGTSGDVQRIPLPTAAGWYRTWAAGGSLEPLAGGGYVLTGAAALVTISTDGRVKADRLPAGYALVDPTREPGMFIVERVDETGTAISIAMPATPRQLWLVSSATGTLTPIVDDAIAVAGSTIGIAAVRRSDGSWWTLGQDAKIVRRSPPSDVTSALDPSAAVVIVQTHERDPACNAGGATSEACQVSLRDAITGQEIVALPGLVQSRFEWGASSTFAYLSRPREADRATDVLVIVRGGVPERIALP